MIGEVFACFQVSSPPMASGALLRGRSSSILARCGLGPTVSHAAMMEMTAGRSVDLLQRVTFPMECGILGS
jgi:hypothetical protein